MSSKSSEKRENTPPDITNRAVAATNNLLPEKSRHNCVSSSHTCPAHIPQSSSHSCEQDPVARRLQIARGLRQAHFEWELACRTAAPRAPPPCPAPYALTGERECARATDGCTYAVVAPAPTAPERCQPGRAPPPPRCVQLAPDDACRIRGNEHLDPCAHRPRVIIEVDRGMNQYGCSTPPPVHPPGAGAATCKSGWGSPSTSHNGGEPPRCRPPTIVEILRARSLACQSNRCTHTSAAVFKIEKCVTPVSGGLEGMLRSKEQLKKAGLGRVVVTDVVDTGGAASARAAPDGRLELHVPRGTERVAVNVSLLAAGSASDSYPAASEPTASPSCTNLDASVRRYPWLPIEKIPKKWTGSGDLGEQSAGARCSGLCSPCGPPTPQRCKPGPAPQESKNETKRCSSTSAFLANTVI